MKNSNSSKGVSVLQLLGIAFVILKLCNIINWSWWWVTLPFYFPFIILFFVWLPYHYYKKSKGK
jgi:hypothetical protein